MITPAVIQSAVWAAATVAIVGIVCFTTYRYYSQR